ncbi:hypothetical protein GCM10022392_01070 [Mucilaginibacter panaciglaebae]|uniref:Reverse transcriptase domain-containing protein n=1 Tax=Mucilaginibacter panaciglaebae TaxID=502331 RepID=A0ABP7WB98_9SPHI
MIDRVDIIPAPPFSVSELDEGTFHNIKSALLKYALANDEIPLYNLMKKLENASYDDARQAIADIYQGKFPDYFDSFLFKRNENDKVRILHSLDHVNNIASTYILSVLNDLFYTEITDNSFGYRLAQGFQNGNIFGNWFVNWYQFSKRISHILNNIEFANYYLIKIDIRSFYDRIDLQRLQIKLYEEVPERVADKLRDVSQEEKNRYRNAVGYLIELSKRTTGNQKHGVPQGPAYARYLAELYLLGMDKLIETELIKDKRREYYYRFVDDIFIFVEDEYKAKHILKELSKWASINNLELNAAKTEIQNVDDYNKSGKFQKFQDDAKYMISKANKNKALLSEQEIQEALARLDSLTNDVKFGLKDNIRFFYFQFSNDKRLNFVKKKLIKYLPFTNNARGTLYMMFYTDLVNTQPETFWSIGLEQERLSGLSLGHYLNTLLLFETLDGRQLDETANLILAVSQRADLSRADQALVLTIARKYNLATAAGFLQTLPKSLIHSAMGTPEIEYNEDDYPYLVELLGDKNKKEFVHELHKIIDQHPLTENLAKLMAGYVITRFSEWSEGEQFDEIVGEEPTLFAYYYSLCFFTLFDNGDAAALQASWENILARSKSIKLTEKISFDWLNRAVNYNATDFSRSAYSMLLANKEGSLLNKHICPNGFLTQFQNILLMLLFSEREQLTEFSADIAAFIEDKTIFGNWLNDPNVKLYPIDDHICIKNLALNGLIVLEKDGDFFVKQVGGNLEIELFNYLDVLESNGSSEAVIKQSAVLPFINPTLNFLDCLKKLALLVKSAEDFRSTFHKAYPVYYLKPYLSKGFPTLPFYSLWPQRVSAKGVNQNNDRASFWENAEFLLNLKHGQIKLLTDNDHQFNFSISELNERFYPKAVMLNKGVDHKISFLEQFLKVVDGQQLASAYDFQYSWSLAVWQSLLTQGNGNSDIYKFLHVHFEQFSNPEDIAKDLLFSVTERTIPDDSTLDALFETIKMALVTFQGQVTQMGDSLSVLVDEERLALNDFISSELSFGLADLRLAKLTAKRTISAVTQQFESVIQINAQTANGNLLLFEREPIGFYERTAEEIGLKSSSAIVFVYTRDENNYIYIVDFELSKAMERIRHRKDILDTGISTVRKLFPEDDTYKIAKGIYEGPKVELLESKLRDHYSATVNIQERVVNWLTIFNPNSIAGSAWKTFLDQNGYDLQKAYRAILESLSLHHALDQVNLKFFKDSMLHHLSNGHILFPLKHPGRDENGLQRIMNRYFNDREVDFEQQVNQLFRMDCSSKTLVLVVDMTITGDQATKAIAHYLKKYTSPEKYYEAKTGNEERYFEFGNWTEKETFIKNWQSIKEVVILTPILTDTFKDKIEGIKAFEGKSLTWEYHEFLQDRGYMFDTAPMDQHNRKIVEALFTDFKLLEKLFVIDNPVKYKEIYGAPSKWNRILRVGSLPKKHIGPFSLHPRNGAQSLLDYIGNWDG